MTEINLILDQAKQNSPVGVTGILQGNANIQFNITLAALQRKCLLPKSPTSSIVAASLTP